MEVLTLIGQARAAGLTVEVEGDTLIVSGPPDAAPLAQQLGQCKADVIAALRTRSRKDDPVRWGSASSRRLIGVAYPARQPEQVPTAILASPLARCPSCGTGVVLPELRSITGGKCYGCWLEGKDAR